MIKWLIIIVYISIMSTINNYFIPAEWHYSFGFVSGTFITVLNLYKPSKG